MKIRIFSSEEVNGVITSKFGPLELVFLGKGFVSGSNYISNETAAQFKELWQSENISYHELKKKELEILLNNTWYELYSKDSLWMISSREIHYYKDIYYLYEAEVEPDLNQLEAMVDDYVDNNIQIQNGELYIVNKKAIYQGDAEWSYKSIARNKLSGLGNGYYCWGPHTFEKKYFSCKEERYQKRPRNGISYEMYEELNSRFYAYKFEINKENYFKQRRAERKNLDSKRLRDYFSVITGDIIMDLNNETVSRMDSFIANNSGEYYLIAEKDIINRNWEM